jgi:ABC-type transport system involved in multi-copper enzyme maturation permease subunit
MSGVIFRETVRRSWRSAALLGLTLSVMALYITAVLNDSRIVETFTQMAANLPFLINTLGGGDAAFMATPLGLINYGYYSWLILAVCGYAVYLGVCVTINDEERGALDVLLSAPVTRTQVLIERLLAFAALDRAQRADRASRLDGHGHLFRVLPPRQWIRRVCCKAR